MKTDQTKYYDSGRTFTEDSYDERLNCILAFLRRSKILELLQPNARVLDIGCANALVLRSLPSTFQRTGVDIASSLLQRAQQAGIETVVSDFDNNPLPLPDDYYDLVLANDVIEHVLHTDHVINEINRVLKPGGNLVVSIPNINQPISCLMQFILDLTPMFAARYRCTHYRDFSNRLFTNILHVHGLAILTKAGSYVYPFEHSPLSRAVARLIPRWGAQIIYLARKSFRIDIDDDFAGSMPELLNWFRDQVHQNKLNSDNS